MKWNGIPNGPNVRAKSGMSDYALQRGRGLKVNLRFGKAAENIWEPLA